ncbi:hypothetical protein B9Z55_010420 [Caenorhabditis nigoni]|uniref:DNA2/NAM7 helicase-like C-terminal domain-containing protein n=1 Tax=Caenorhabditis nigoni TaxID=1611254 RepID=A0A2G5UFR2_9PELO|nr:hypothetical protein B9Z55_010420 [Caenorhabditis nigoni]
MKTRPYNDQAKGNFQKTNKVYPTSGFSPVLNKQTQAGTSLIKIEKAKAAIRIARTIQTRVGTDDIGIRCFNKAQTGQASSLLGDSPFYVGIIDGSQGHELNTVIILTTRTLPFREEALLRYHPWSNDNTRLHMEPAHSECPQRSEKRKRRHGCPCRWPQKGLGPVSNSKPGKKQQRDLPGSSVNPTITSNKVSIQLTNQDSARNKAQEMRLAATMYAHEHIVSCIVLI